MRYALGFDGDDTLWPNEVRFVNVASVVKSILSSYVDIERFDERLLATERRNLQVFGYGAKGYLLSLIETSIELSDGAISAREIFQILEEGKRTFAGTIELFPGVTEALAQLGPEHELILITKGDLFEQEQKIAQSGIVDHFKDVRILSEKTAQAYRDLLDSCEVTPSRFVMIGNSLRSDVLPVLEIGAYAILVPCEHTWEFERDGSMDSILENADTRRRFREASHIGDVPALIAEMVAATR